MDLFDREKARLKKKKPVSFFLFHFMYNVPYISMNKMSLTIWLLQISKYTKSTQLQIAKVFLIPLVIFIFIIMITVTIQLNTAFVLLCNY